jgi:hypothetical protein
LLVVHKVYSYRVPGWCRRTSEDSSSRHFAE